jgi:hypothetical protein
MSNIGHKPTFNMLPDQKLKFITQIYYSLQCINNDDNNYYKAVILIITQVMVYLTVVLVLLLLLAVSMLSVTSLLCRSNGWIGFMWPWGDGA